VLQTTVAPVSKKRTRKRRGIRGGGDYVMEDSDQNEILRKLDLIGDKIEKASLGGMVKSAAPKVGSLVGSMFGNAALGKRIGEGASKLFGFGDYTISSNSLIPGSNHNLSEALVPKFGNGKNSVRIREREYLGDVIGSDTTGAFQNQVYPVNPQNAITFPWLSQIALLYEQWVPHGIVFEFVSTSADWSGVGQQLGTVIMATDYNADDPLFTSKVVMENEDFSNSTKPSCNAMHGLECDPKQRPLGVMYMASSGGLKFTTLGNFQLATVGCPTGYPTLGELWVSYDISLMKKSIQTASGGVFWGIYGTAISGASPFGATPTIVAGSSNQFSYNVVVGAGVNLVLPQGSAVGTRYLLVYTWLGSASTFPYTNIEVPGNLTVVQTRQSNSTTSSNVYTVVIEIGGADGSNPPYAISILPTTASDEFAASVTIVGPNFVN